MKSGAIFGLCMLGVIAVQGISQMIRYPAAKKGAEELVRRIPEMSAEEMDGILKLNRPLPCLPFDICGRVRNEALGEVVKGLSAAVYDIFHALQNRRRVYHFPAL